MSVAHNPFRGYRPARPALYDASSQHRRAMIAKIKIAVKELQICDDDYRAMLARLTGETSAADCTEAGLAAVLNELKDKGFQAQPKKAPPRAADHRPAMKARALWISLHHLGAITNPSERELEAFARRQLKCDRLQWADQGQMFKLIEALKAIGARHGWDITGRINGGPPPLKLIKIRLCEAILVKLKAAGYAAETWDLRGAASRIAGFDTGIGKGPIFWSDGELDTLARTFGNLLRNGHRGDI